MPCFYDGGSVYDGGCTYGEDILVWRVDVDWNGDGVFEGFEAGHTIGMRVRRGREHPLRADGKGLEKHRVGEAVILLENQDRRYDPLYTSSPLYPNVKPGPEVRMQVSDGTTTWDVLRGNIYDIVPLGAQRQARLVVHDGWERLEQREVRYATQAGLSTGEAIARVLTQAQYPSAWGSDLDGGSDTIPYWWIPLTSAGETAADALRSLADSEFGLLYVAANGAVTFIERTALYNATAALTLDQSQVLQEIAIPQPWEVVRNIAAVTIHPQVALTFVKLWTLGETLYFEYDETKVIWAKLLYDNKPAAIKPGASIGGGFVMNTLEDGSGTSIGDPTATFENYGTLVKITFRNNNFMGVGGYLTYLDVQANAVYAPYGTTLEDDASAGSAYGPRRVALDLQWQQNTDRAKQFAIYLADRYGISRSQPVVQLEGRPTMQFAYDLAAVVEFTSDYYGIDQLTRLMGIEHEWLTPNGQSIRTTWNLEPADETAYWILGTSELGTETKLAY